MEKKRMPCSPARQMLLRSLLPSPYVCMLCSCDVVWANMLDDSAPGVNCFVGPLVVVNAGGGHSYEAMSLINNGLVIDLAKMDHMRLVNTSEGEC